MFVYVFYVAAMVQKLDALVVCVTPVTLSRHDDDVELVINVTVQLSPTWAVVANVSVIDVPEASVE